MSALGYNPRALWQSIQHYTGYSQKENTERSAQVQIGYNEYLRGAYERQYADWQKNVGRKGLTIRYPELSYPGKIRSVDTANARANFDVSTANANFVRNLYGIAGSLYNPGGYISRYL